MSSFLVVANRLPVRRQDGESPSTWTTSPGGLVAALAPVLEGHPGSVWVGWTGSVEETFEPFSVDGIDMEPVPLTQDEFERYYEGFCNATLWPLYHDAVIRSEYHRSWWEVYRAINRRFTEHACARAGEGAIVWVHDYQLQLMPAQLRERRPDLRIGFFLHIPFPPIELFLQLPWRRQVLEGIVGADVVGFQTPQGAANFRALVERCEVGEVDGDDLIVDGRRIEVRAFPIGVDAAKLQRMARDPAIRARAASLRGSLGNPAKVLLGVDRLDYTKGIARRLEAFGELLDDGRLKVPRQVMVQVAEPTRENVPGYSEFREQIDQIVGEINGKHGRFGHPAVNYIHRSQPIEELVALYLVADVMLVTPVRDGMNLVAKEYVACRTDNRGVLILSEFTGAANSMSSALMVNPYDIEGLKSTIDRAIHIPDDEERRRMRELREGVIADDVHRWAADWLQALGVAVETEC